MSCKNFPPSMERKRMRGITHEAFFLAFHHGTCPRHLFAKFSSLDKFLSLHFFLFFNFLGGDFFGTFGTF